MFTCSGKNLWQKPVSAGLNHLWQKLANPDRTPHPLPLASGLHRVDGIQSLILHFSAGFDIMKFYTHNSKEQINPIVIVKIFSIRSLLFVKLYHQLFSLVFAISATHL